MTGVPFAKVESVGNDFVLVRASDLGDQDPSELAKVVSERRFGIGSDGLLVLGSDLLLRMFNPDGSEDFCGNGSRCAALFALREGWLRGSATLSHRGRDVRVQVRDGGWIRAHFPPASDAPAAVPVDSAEPWIGREVCGLVGTAISTGSAHFVALVDALPEDERFFDVSPRIEQDPVFPERISVMWTVAEEDRLRLRIWERGAGETLGCGTGAVAAATVWARVSGRSGPFEVISKGGTTRIGFDEGADGPAWAETQPTLPYEGVWVESGSTSQPTNCQPPA